MECECEMGFDDSGGIDLFSSKIVKARKKHVCEECRSSIQIGDEYECTKGKWDGEFATYKTCKDCLSLRNQFFTKSFTIGQMWMEFLDSLHDWNYEVPEDCIIELSTKTREKVCKAIEEGWKHSD